VENDISVETQGGIGIVRCAGQIDSNTYFALKDVIRNLIKNSGRSSKVVFIVYSQQVIHITKKCFSDVL
jgi:S-adenosylmethionine synthetase